MLLHVAAFLPLYSGLVFAAALQPRASPAPCKFSCPPQDKSGATLEGSNDTGVVLICTYPYSNFCFYATTRDGSLAPSPSNNCPDRAVASPAGCTPTRKRGEKEAIGVERKRRAAARAAKLPAEVKKALKSRSDLGKQKHNNREV